MKIECCVPGCQSSRFNVPFHKFPRNLEQFLAWKAAVYSDKIREVTDSELCNRMMCYRHFICNDYVVGSKIRKLKSGVIPSVALPCATAVDTAISTSAVELEGKPQAQAAIQEYLEQNCYSFITCAVHQQQIRDLFVHECVRVCLQNWTGYINKILMGKESPYVPADSIQNEIFVVVGNNDHIINHTHSWRALLVEAMSHLQLPITTYACKIET